MRDIDAYFNEARRLIFYKFTQPQVDGIKLITAYCEQQSVPLNHAAYILATTKWETAHTMEPIKEYGRGRGKKYGKPAGPYNKIYYGRGYVQLTWLDNYRRATKKLGVNFVKDPDKVMKPQHAVRILVHGMLEGWFTGMDLDDFIDMIDEPDSEDLKEFIRARKTVNGTDKARQIGEIALLFEKALKKGGYGKKRAPQLPTDGDSGPSEGNDTPDVENPSGSDYERLKRCFQIWGKKQRNKVL